MKKTNNTIKVIITSLCFVILILDTKTAITGANKGIELCINRILPSLLPFCILSKIFCAEIIGQRIPLWNRICKLTGMPNGTESILLVGLIGGYPIGAQCIEDAYLAGALTKNDSARLLSFCNNAGPAFIFGVLSCVFPTAAPLWSLYTIHILSAIIVGMLMPNKTKTSSTLTNKRTLSIFQAVESSAKTISIICIWIIIFKIFQQILARWIFAFLDTDAQVLLSGIVELSNGCLSLTNIERLGLRYILCSLFLSLGGCSVTLQTFFVAKDIPKKNYFLGKFLQTACSIVLAVLTQPLLFTQRDRYPGSLLMGICAFLCLVTPIFLYQTKNKYSNYKIYSVQ